MAYTNHIETIREALHLLLIAEFNVKVDFNIEFNPGFGKNEYIRYFFQGDNFVSSNSDGETREYTFDIDIYINTAKIDKTKFTQTASKRIEQLNQLLSYYRTYQPSNVYKWHDSRIESIEIDRLEDVEGFENVKIIRCEYTVVRTGQWA